MKSLTFMFFCEYNNIRRLFSLERGDFMNKIKLLSIFLIILAILILNCDIKYKTHNNKNFSEIKSRFDNLLYKYNCFDDELPVIVSQKYENSYKSTNFINKDEAIEDIEYLFSLLKFGYAGYEYFGGDNIFTPAKENIIWSVTALNRDICVNEFLDIIYSELKFIQDSHFTIGKYKLCNYTKYFSSRSFTFYKGDIGFYTFIENEAFYIKNVNGDTP